VDSHLHHPHGAHCDDHGRLEVTVYSDVRKNVIAGKA
jgi:hypothetical protein